MRKNQVNMKYPMSIRCFTVWGAHRAGRDKRYIAVPDPELKRAMMGRFCINNKHIQSMLGGEGHPISLPGLTISYTM